jgi:hypothetical protein
MHLEDFLSQQVDLSISLEPINLRGDFRVISALYQVISFDPL